MNGKIRGKKVTKKNYTHKSLCISRSVTVTNVAFNRTSCIPLKY